MRAFAIDRFGGPASIQELPEPSIGPADVLVRIRTAGVNPIDWKVAEGAKAGLDIRFPYVLGQDAAGVVEKVGSEVARFKAGDEVFGAFWLSGSYAELVRGSPKAALALKPANADFDSAAALPTAALAALASVNAVDVKPGQIVLIIGATGSVGGYALQIAADRGAYIIATAPEDDADRLKHLGAFETIDYHKEDVFDAVNRSHPERLDAIIDVVSDRAALARMAGLLRPGSRLATTVHAADVKSMADHGIKAANVDVLGTTEGLDEIARLIDAQKLKVMIEKVFPLDLASEAVSISQRGRLRGRVLIKIS
ncbi:MULTISPECIES: NADP-dependent oxidoreductase [unclassified Bradyrhizobium]|uniref:NADP-dependent oxidoreductase n=1 Tax=unclassified Bradyrhizobium TaxID=2631580 RepID=UPI00247A545B|nr:MULTISPECIES: NADP-dependent oxidoreductase [unclassified Bradyrhizobium]WGR73183.1 NADP-dependent oxidoreductase [Bradyrhizobium sp. ISRA426]WGR78022.1 NADP-dependent oxidoreductase [Bradyrhizobium sp. ISRA430]WGR88423.1 NADP-dependent oxidoreductase [Bradyrhizobium sp. ISRA432]